MKKTILLSSIFAVGAAFATEVTSGNAIGALDKAISTTDAKQVLIAVPFPGYDGAASAISIKDIVKTGNLDKDSKLFVPNGTTGGYDTLKLDANGTWVSDTKVTIDAKGVITAGASLGSQDVKINRGDSFWLEPKFKSGTTGKVFLLGQAATGAGTSTAVEGWNLIGNASVGAVSLAELEGTDNDQIVVQVNGALRYYTYKATKGGWRYTTSSGTWSKPSEEPLTINAGQGFWYKPATATTIDWSTGKKQASAL